MTLSGYVYHCAGGESFDSVALEVYKDEKYAAEIMTANPHLTRKNVFSGGEIVRLPVIEIPEERDGRRYVPTKAPWKE